MRLTWTARICIPHTTALVLAVNREVGDGAVDAANSADAAVLSVAEAELASDVPGSDAIDDAR